MEFTFQFIDTVGLDLEIGELEDVEIPLESLVFADPQPNEVTTIDDLIEQLKVLKDKGNFTGDEVVFVRPENSDDVSDWILLSNIIAPAFHLDHTVDTQDDLPESAQLVFVAEQNDE